MAWRIDEHLVRSEIDNRTPGIITGKLWLIDRKEAKPRWRGRNRR